MELMAAEAEAQANNLHIWDPGDNAGGPSRNYRVLVPWWCLRHLKVRAVMKTSHYIKSLNEDNRLYVYNLFTQAVLSFPTDSLKLIEHILDYPNIDYQNKEIENAKKMLYSNGCLVDDDFDELENLRKRYNVARNERNTLASN
jgi:hypothetical protein